ncbi:MAG: hypothetical protein R3F59_00490 [Myxococcota bacterium]
MFAVVMMLMGMVFMVMVVAVFLIFSVVMVNNNQKSTKDGDLAVIAPINNQPNNATPVDTGVVAPPIDKPPPRPVVRPTGPRPDPTPRPAAPPSVGTVSVTMAPGSPVFTSIEITCNNGDYRQRAPFSNGTASRNDVPNGDCTLYFKGGPPGNVKVRPGMSLTCQFTGGGPTCK